MPLARPLCTNRLPLLAAIAILATPNLVFLATHLASPTIAVATLACAAATLVLIVRDAAGSAARPLNLPLLAGCLATALALCLLGGQGHVFFANEDWLLRDAVLRDLVVAPWPVGYVHGGEPNLLRAPLGLYLAPALAGKALGLGAAHAALDIHNTLLFGSILYALVDAFQPGRRRLWIAATFVLFSGWDIVGFLKTGEPLAFGTHIEWWVPGLQFSSHVTQLFWVPNHAAAGWCFAAAYLAWRRGMAGLPTLVAVFGFGVFWSPLAAIGAAPFVALAAISDMRAGRLRVSDVACAALPALALLPVALYLATDLGRVPRGEKHLGWAFWPNYLTFLTLEIGPVLLFLRHFGTGEIPVLRRADLWVILVVLLAVPLYQIGGNDFVMRASIPALALLAIAFAERAWPAGEALRPERTRIALAVLAIGAITPLSEIVRAVRMPTYRISDCNMPTAARFPPNDGPLFHYVARASAADTRVLKAPTTYLSADGRATCWPDRATPP